MIDRDATIAKFGYDPDTLSRGSNKKVVAVCDVCGKERNPKKKEYHNLCVSCAQKKRYEDPKEHEKSRAAQNKYHKDHPEARGKQSDAAKKHWKDPEAREKQSATRKKHFKDNPTAHKKLSAAKKKFFEDHPEAREKQRVAMNEYHKDHPDAGDRHSVRMRKRYENPEEREKTSVAGKKFFEDPEARKKQSARRKKHFKDNPKAHEKLSAARKKFFENHPEAIEKMSVAQEKYAKENPISAETRKKISAAQQGINYEDWVAFAKDKPYCPKFNEACRESNREKYGRRCFICGLPEAENITSAGKQKKLSVHHVDLNKNQGCNGHEWKLVPICLRHHKQTHTVLWIARITYLLRNIDYNHHQY